jgi:formylglycine-generating enzyme required for sulfatase activity
VLRDIAAPWCPELVVLPAGRFVMGASIGDAKARADEHPSSEITFDRGFAVGRSPVTFEEYLRFCEATGAAVPEDDGWGRDRHPVINVSWHDASAYAAWLMKVTGEPYRLPSEAEWEYACRAGTTTPYFTGATIGAEQANFARRVRRTTPVGQYPSNPWGLLDMLGNVWEWTLDTYRDSLAAMAADGSAWVTGGDRKACVLRGGSWAVTARDLRSSARISLAADTRASRVGFRVARSLEA